MKSEELKQRTKLFAIRNIKLIAALPKSKISEVLGKQLLRSATAVGANYRAACRARSGAEFISKIAIVEEEADESMYWLELISDCELIKPQYLDKLISEANELTAIFTSSRKTARINLKGNQKKSAISNNNVKYDQA